MSQPFVKIINDKLSLVGAIPNGNPRVISILGKARMGKSTFLNAVVSHLRKESQAPFKAMDCDDHCTRGIDAYYMEEHNLLLLDSQGLDYEDASHDPHLLLLLYILSDVIIFNDTRRLENGALKLMESVCTFTNYLDIDTVVKPKLYFRIFDSDVKDPQKNLEKVLGSYPDQYQSIRNSIKHLFHQDIRLLKTEPLDRPAKIMLANNMYRELLTEPLGFREAIECILSASKTAEQKSVLGDVPSVISKINENQEISIEKLDVVKLQAENDIHKWIQDSVPSSVYTELVVDGTNKCFEEVVEPRKNQKKAILTAFTKRFKDVEESIRGPFYKTLQEKMDAPIQKAIEVSRWKAQEMIKKDYTNARSVRSYALVDSLNNSFTTVPADYWYNYLGIFNSLETSIQSIYEPIRKEVMDWIEQVRFVLRHTIEKVKEDEKKEKLAASKLCADMLTNIESWMLGFVEGMITDITVVQSNNQLMDMLKTSYIEEFEKELATLVPRRKIYFKISQTGVLVPSIDMVSTKNIKTYDLIKTVYDFFVDKVQQYTKNPDIPIRAELVAQKEKFLYGKLLPSSTPIQGPMDSIAGWKLDSWTQKLVSSNPEIHFIDDEIVRKNLQNAVKNKSYSIMTAKTHFETYGKLYASVISDLVAKNYVSEEYSKKIVHAEDHTPGEETVINVYKADSKYDSIVEDLFVKRLQKNYCKKTVAGFAFPQIISETEIFKNSEPVKTVKFDETATKLVAAVCAHHTKPPPPQRFAHLGYSGAMRHKVKTGVWQQHQPSVASWY